MDTSGRVEGFDLTDPDGLLRAWGLDLLLQGCLWFYFTLTPQEGRGHAGAESGASGEAGSGWLSWFPSTSTGPIQQKP